MRLTSCCLFDAGNPLLVAAELRFRCLSDPPAPPPALWEPRGVVVPAAERQGRQADPAALLPRRGASTAAWAGDPSGTRGHAPRRSRSSHRTSRCPSGLAAP